MVRKIGQVACFFAKIYRKFRYEQNIRFCVILLAKMKKGIQGNYGKIQGKSTTQPFDRESETFLSRKAK